MSEPSPDVFDPEFNDQVVRRLHELVAHETPSGDVDSLNSFVAHLEARWQQLGINTQRNDTPGGPVLVGDVAGRGWGADLESVLLIAHSDTVWPLGTLASRLPWSVDDGGTARGPGIFDMKSGLVIIESVVGLLAAASTGHPPLRIFVAPDEETGSTHSRSLLEQASRGCCAALGFESPHPDGSLKIGRFGSTRLRVTVSGRAAHAALDPERGVSAIDELVDQLLVIRQLVASLADDEHQILLNVGSLEALGKTNVVSASASAQIGLRFARTEEEDRLLPALAKLAPIRTDAVVSVVIESHRPAWAPSANDLALGTRLLPDLPVGRPSRGAADTNTVVASGLAVVDGLGATGGGAHALDEHIVVASMWPRIRSLCEAFGDERRWLPR